SWRRCTGTSMASIRATTTRATTSCTKYRQPGLPVISRVTVADIGATSVSGSELRGAGVYLVVTALDAVPGFPETGHRAAGRLACGTHAAHGPPRDLA